MEHHDDLGVYHVLLFGVIMERLLSEINVSQRHNVEITIMALSLLHAVRDLVVVQM